jgi:hypothetical protein
MLTKRLPARTGCRWARIAMTLLHTVLAGWLLLWTSRCIWPNTCGEGFAAGYAAGAVGLMAAVWALLWLLTEGLMLFCRTKRKAYATD